MTRLSNSTAARRLPGDPSLEEQLARIIRVDHAGEYGAKRIYAGQLAVMRRRRSPHVATVSHMAEQEQLHLDAFADQMRARRVRPTALLPVWHVAGFALGAATALLGDRAAMACTIAVEEVIEDHYNAQIAQLGDDEAALKADLAQFRDDEVAHRDTGVTHGGRTAPGWPLLEGAIKTGCRAAIRLAARI